MQSIVVLFIMSLVVFTMINLVGDPVDMLVNPESLPDEIERVRSDFGLDQPAHIQYIKFLQGALSGDLGNSFIFGRPALALIAERFPATLELATCALIIAIVFGAVVSELILTFGWLPFKVVVVKFVISGHTSAVVN